MEMERVALRDGDFGVDLECGLGVSVDDSDNEPILGAKIPVKTVLSKVCCVLGDGKTKGEEGLILCVDVLNFNGVSAEQAKLEGEKTADHAEQKVVNEKRKKKSNKKPPRPPRPPRAPSLDAANQKLSKEISELVLLKRARIERMKALKKMKAVKASSSDCNLFAMVFTILFCLVIILQGMPSKGTAVRGGSPLSTGMAEDGLISVQFAESPSVSDPNGDDSGSSNPVVQVDGSGSSEKMRKAARLRQRK